MKLKVKLKVAPDLIPPPAPLAHNASDGGETAVAFHTTCSLVTPSDVHMHNQPHLEIREGIRNVVRGCLLAAAPLLLPFSFSLLCYC